MTAIEILENKIEIYKRQQLQRKEELERVLLEGFKLSEDLHRDIEGFANNITDIEQALLKLKGE